MNEVDNPMSSYKEQVFDSNPSETNTKIFLCNICHKDFKIHFHLKQHIRKAHENKNAYSYDNDQKSFSKLDDLNTPINSIHNDNE